METALSVSVLVCFMQLLSFGSARAEFSSHVHVTTPEHSYSHGVGDPISAAESSKRRHTPPIRKLQNLFRTNIAHSKWNGYPRLRPTFPFRTEDIPSLNIFWKQKNLKADTLPLLPPSPYKVDSPDPESLWPAGLFFPPINPPRFETKRSKTYSYGTGKNDPYLLEGLNAIAAVNKSRRHGHLYFHDIPHIESLLANQEHRIKNNLPPHRIGSIRSSWPYKRP